MYTINDIGGGRYSIVNPQTGDEWIWPDENIPAEVLQSVLHEINAAISERAQGEEAASVDMPSGGSGGWGRRVGEQMKRANSQRGLDQFNMAFHSHSPSGWGQGGWNPMGPPWTAQQYNQAYVDNYRARMGMAPRYAPGGPGGRWGSPLRDNPWHSSYGQSESEPAREPNRFGWSDEQQARYDNMSDIRRKNFDLQVKHGFITP